MSMKSPMKFANKSTAESSQKEVWKVLIVDDEQSVHSITNTVLNGITFDNKKLEFISAYSGTQAREIMESNPDIALILLDVVMENDNAGLEFVDFVRNELSNKFVRIVLRTGQPGYAPEKEVIDQYDINDYKEKTELTAQKLYTTVITSLRNYKDLKELESEKIAINVPKENKMVFEFAKNALNKLIETISENSQGRCQNFEAIVIEIIKKDKLVLAATKKLEGLDYETFCQKESTVAEQIEKAIKIKSSLQFDGGIVNYYEDESGNENILYLSCNKNLSQNDVQLIEMFSFNLSSAVELYYK
jgi:CheY-like chemotaxis protein